MCWSRGLIHSEKTDPSQRVGILCPWTPKLEDWRPFTYTHLGFPRIMIKGCQLTCIALQIVLGAKLQT